jgi:superfamily II DNA helicase RecQ
MAYQFFVMPFDEDRGQIDDGAFQKLQERARIKQVQASFFQSKGGQAFWTLFVDYEEILEHKPTSRLSEKQGWMYNQIRSWRNTRAEEDGIAPYVIANNKQVEQMAILEDPTLEALTAIKGFGAGKAEKYGKDLVAYILMKKEEYEKP